MQLLCSPFTPVDLPEMIEEGGTYPAEEYEPFNYDALLAGPSDETEGSSKPPMDYFEYIARTDDHKYTLPLTYSDLVKPKSLNTSIDVVLWISVFFFTMNEAMLGWILYIFLAFVVIVGCKILLPTKYLPSLYTKSPLLFWSTLFAFLVCAPNIFNLGHKNALVPTISPWQNVGLLLPGSAQQTSDNTSVALYSGLSLVDNGMCPALASNVCLSPYYNSSASIGAIKPVSNRSIRFRQAKKTALEMSRKASLNGATKTTSQGPTKTSPSTLTTVDETKNEENAAVINKVKKEQYIFNETDNVKHLFDRYYQMELDLRTKRWHLMEELSKVESELNSVTFYTVPSKKLINARVLGNQRLLQ
ncbi:hypothetical protein INT47_000449 [Mucor saturninus]|uniref:Uncharacterized protein n=1 Tax=Mucor saturninus TaxID=64648 RepID=A0A8H7QKS5_9FUNG|nr:hypothetical protein INT47_000449 [Mucor saturninus]